MRITVLVFFLITTVPSFAQNGKGGNLKDTVSASKKNELRMAAYLKRAEYPLFKMSKWSGVIPVADPTEIPDRTMQFKLLMEDVFPVKDSSAKEINGGLAEIGRLINLHIASGIPIKNIHVVAVVHGPALFALLNNDAYRKKYGIDNPNIPFIKELSDNGVRFIACGQAMYVHDIDRSQMLPAVKISITAQTVLSNYQLKGYVLHTITEEN